MANIDGLLTIQQPEIEPLGVAAVGDKPITTATGAEVAGVNTSGGFFDQLYRSGGEFLAGALTQVGGAKVQAEVNRIAGNTTAGDPADQAGGLSNQNLAREQAEQRANTMLYVAGGALALAVAVAVIVAVRK